MLPVILCLLALSTGSSHADQSSSGGLFKGTPEEQKACRHDSVKFCSDAIPDSLRVLACLKDHRKNLTKACKEVLENHGQ
jgi:hypothetical protein